MPLLWLFFSLPCQAEAEAAPSSLPAYVVHIVAQLSRTSLETMVMQAIGFTNDVMVRQCGWVGDTIGIRLCMLLFAVSELVSCVNLVCIQIQMILL